MSYRDPLEFDLTLSAHAHDLGCQTVANMIKPKGPRLSVQLDAADMKAKIDAQLAANLFGGNQCRSATGLVFAAPRPMAEVIAEWRDLIGLLDRAETPFSDGIKSGLW